MSTREAIRSGLENMSLDVSSRQTDQLEQLVQQLQKWNRTFNLTAIRSERESVTHHVLDSLSIYPFVAGMRLLDVGSGGGFPGLPLAILFPDKRVSLLDSNEKKTRFLQQMQIELGLANCQVIKARVETHVGTYDQITCRAFASLADIAEKTAHLLSPGGEVLAMKGRLTEEERMPLTQSMRIRQIHTLTVPELEGERHLVVLERASYG